MRIGIVIVFVGGIVLSGLAGSLVYSQLTSLEAQLAAARAEAEKVVPVREVYIANDRLQYGDALSKENVTTFEWPIDNVVEGSFSSEEELFGVGDQLERRIVLQSMEKGDLILASRISEIGEDAGLVSRLASGLRAFTISVQFAAGAASLLRPGDRVDLYWSGRNQDDLVTRLLLDNIELIAIGNNTDADIRANNPAKTVTIAVDPTTVAELVQAQESGRLLLSLRGLTDEDASGDIELTQDEFLGVEEEVAAPTKRRCVTKVRRGTEIVLDEIPCPE